LSRFPKAVQELVLQHHPDLYRQTKVGWPSLTIEKGRVTLESINRAPFGVGFEMALEDIPSAPRFEACQVGRLNL
jgi:hypothetical protein